MRSAILFLTLLGCGAAEAAPAAPSPASSPASSPTCAPSTDLAAVSALVGEWNGDGWVQMGPGARERFVQTEIVRCAVGGEALLVEGLGRDAARPDRLVHQALAVIAFDRTARTLHIRAYSAGRPAVDSDLTSGESAGELVWGMDVPGGNRVRFRLQVTGDRWREVGEISIQGGPWRQFLEMNLRRGAADGSAS
jgi:hypothetical protein